MANSSTYTHTFSDSSPISLGNIASAMKVMENLKADLVPQLLYMNRTTFGTTIKYIKKNGSLWLLKKKISLSGRDIDYYEYGVGLYICVKKYSRGGYALDLSSVALKSLAEPSSQSRPSMELL